MDYNIHFKIHKNRIFSLYLGANELPEALPQGENSRKQLKCERVNSRFFMKLFRTTNMDTIRLCQDFFNFELPSDTIKRRTLKFESAFVSTLVKM